MVVTPRKCALARVALERVGEATHFNARVKAGRVDLLDGRGEQQVDAFGLRQYDVPVLVAGIALEVFARAELSRIYEQRDHDEVAVLPSPPDQRKMALVKEPHRGNKPDRAARSTLALHRLAQLGHITDGPHALAPSDARTRVW
jgi:hypothetical protein